MLPSERGWALKVAEQFPIRGLVAYKPVAYKPVVYKKLSVSSTELTEKKLYKSKREGA